MGSGGLKVIGSFMLDVEGDDIYLIFREKQEIISKPGTG